jgi:hypothetical protein
MARGINGSYGANTASHPGRTNFTPSLTGDPEPPAPTPLPFSTGAILMAGANPNAPDGVEQQMYENLTDMGVGGAVATDLIHQTPAYKWYQHDNAQRVAALQATPTEGVGTAQGGGSSGASAVAPPEHYNYGLTDIIRATHGGTVPS